MVAARSLFMPHPAPVKSCVGRQKPFSGPVAKTTIGVGATMVVVRLQGREADVVIAAPVSKTGPA